jgi:hypothetical protein
MSIVKTRKICVRVFVRCCFILFVISPIACSTNTIGLYSENTPALDIKTFFQGELSAKGIVEDYRGRIIRYFNAEIHASWQGDTGTLREVFYFNDGATEYRTWTLIMTGDNVFVGTAGDVVGESKGEQSGNAVFMNYILSVAREGGSTIDMAVDDKMYLVTPDTIINETRLSKFGVELARVILTIQKIPLRDAL